MSEYTIDVVKSDIAALGKNVIKIRKYIRDHQAQLQGFSTTSLNKALRENIPAGMVLKRNYNVLSLRSAGAPATEAPAPAPKKKQVVVEEHEEESDESEEDVERTVRRPVRRPPEENPYAAPELSYAMPHYMMSNEDLAKNCFLEVAQRKWRRYA